MSAFSDRLWGSTVLNASPMRIFKSVLPADCDVSAPSVADAAIPSEPVLEPDAPEQAVSHKVLLVLYPFVHVNV